MSPTTAILYQNAHRDITLLDIPTTIAVAQGISDVLLSSSPPDEPYTITNEPKNVKAKEKLVNNTVDKNLHAAYRTEIERALTEIRHHVSGVWCLPRKLMTQVPRPRKSDMEIDDPETDLDLRLNEWSESKGVDDGNDFTKLMASFGLDSETNATSSDSGSRCWLMSYGPAGDITKDPQGNEPGPRQEPWRPSFHNAKGYTLSLEIASSASQVKSSSLTYQFKVPPRSSFFLDDSTQWGSFRASFRRLTEEYNLPRHFDFILLDPPWPNRSAQRKATYKTSAGLRAIEKLILKMDIDTYIEHNGLVGIWITNKPSLRDLVLGPKGLFEQLNVGFIEEWIWIKTTKKGEPIWALESIVKKPYEVLLLGRAAPNSWTTMKPVDQIKRRVIAGVPDLHSRKPCLKELIEPFMPDPNDYTALEIFARYLVAGWTSWGNEVLKFNWNGYWAPD
ncbi:MT-A70-domain-containing protein [Zopfia rhizophila CBS 207.26]|uniref:MT-A70-domain-containing protein n=1 Tax=Zopfia rhizophila CBS 207.26 TaxID=1314779 RepID=A0A6A6EEI6_9PEZI|nr:MT-A70-domain-containing protein [Zopfia rhizophila CBS 207.26]